MLKPTEKMGRFTLVELLVVMAIIAVLTAILLPSLVQARLLAKRIACLNAVSQLNIAVMLYADDNEDAIPVVASNYRNNFVDENYSEKGHFTDDGCPHGPGRYDGSNRGNEYYWDYRNPATGVGMNPILLGGHGQTIPLSAGPAYRGALTYRSIRLAKHGEVTPVTMDQYYVARWNGVIGSTAYGARDDALKIHLRAMSGGDNYNIPYPYKVGAARHNGQGLNYSFVDGSARFIPTWDAFKVMTRDALVYRDAISGFIAYNDKYNNRYIDR